MMRLHRRVERLERARPSHADDVDPVVATFIIGLSRQERQALLAKVHGRALSAEQGVALAVAEKRWRETRGTR
jgi:hypothetical protein